MKRIVILAGVAISFWGLAPAPSAVAQATKPGASAAPKAGARPSSARPATGATTGAAKTKRPDAAQAPAAGAAARPLTEDEKAAFAFGAQVGEQAVAMIRPLQLNPAEMEAFQRGLAAALAGEKSPYSLQQYGQRLDARAQANLAQEATRNAAKGTEFRERAASEPGARTTASGLVFKSLKPGTGASPSATDVVRVHYRGTLVDGTEFDSSQKQGGPATFPLGKVIPCWTEGLQLMKTGEKARLVCPPAIAYGDRGQGPIPPGATLMFEVELVGIGAETKPEAKPEAPALAPK
jgi:FKBP-type peptidyl-prolyl cis-trans isomerase FkpA